MGQIYSLTSDEAEEVMAAAIKKLKGMGKRASVSIVNHARTEIAKAVMDGVRPFTARVAFMKASQAAYTGKTTSKTAKEVKDGDKALGVIGISPNDFVEWAGGAPIYDNENRLLGGIGISNLDPKEDAEVAESAVFEAGFKL